MNNRNSIDVADGLNFECYQGNTGYKWCNVCNAKHFKQNFKKWTNDNDGSHTSLWAEPLQKDYYYATLFSYKHNPLIEEIVLPVTYKTTLGITSIARRREKYKE
ncbi:unnamed protein product [Rhizophagus irregularis]|nr:unnamed protein product [Rhizophagus irregularis]